MVRWSIYVLILCSSATWAQEPLRLYYYERPPYMITANNGTVTGISASRVQRALIKTGIPFLWEKLPAKRQLMMIQSNTQNACGVGWYKTPERQTFAQFSLPVFTDKAPVIIAKPTFIQPPISTLKDLLSNPKTRILMKEGLTYGHYISTQIQQAKASISTVTLEQAQMLDMIAADRADFMFATREEADYAFKQQQADKKSFKIIELKDIPAGENRYLMCSQTVSAEQLNRINAGINALPAQP